MTLWVVSNALLALLKRLKQKFSNWFLACYSALICIFRGWGLSHNDLLWYSECFFFSVSLCCYGGLNVFSMLICSFYGLLSDFEHVVAYRSGY